MKVLVNGYNMMLCVNEVPPTKMRKLTHQQSSDSEEEESRSPGKRRRQVISNDSEEEQEKGEPSAAAEAGEGEASAAAAEAGEEEPPAEAAAGAGKKAAKVVKTERIHHKTTRCRVTGCAFKGQDLLRHLRRVHLKKGEISGEGLSGFNKIMSQGNKARRPRSQGQRSQGRLKKWCPVEGCGSLVSYLTKPLRRAHNLAKDSAELANMAKEARSYKGLSELTVVSSDEEPLVPQAPTLTQKPKENNKEGQKGKQTPPPASSEDEEEEEPDHHGVSDPEEVAKDPSEDNHSDHETDDEPSDDTSPESESDESEEPAENQEEYFTATSYKNYHHQWLCGFYLSLPDVGNKKKDGRLQHARQVEILLEAIDKDGDDITPLAGQGGDIVWLNWVKPAMDNRLKAPGTIISYLTSLEKFLTFVTSSKYRIKEMPPLSQSYKEAFANLIPCLRGQGMSLTTSYFVCGIPCKREHQGPQKPPLLELLRDVPVLKGRVSFQHVKINLIYFF